MNWRKHRSIGDYLPATHESYPYVVRRENRFRSVLEINPGPVKLGVFKTVIEAKKAARKHQLKST